MRSAAGTKPSKRKRIFDIIQIAGGNDPASRTFDMVIIVMIIVSIIITTALQVPSAIFTESFLSFVGMGVKAPMPSLGSLANAARQGLQSYPMQLVFPAVTIILIVLAFNLLGDGLRDAFDPKLRR